MPFQPAAQGQLAVDDADRQVARRPARLVDAESRVRARVVIGARVVDGEHGVSSDRERAAHEVAFFLNSHRHLLSGNWHGHSPSDVSSFLSHDWAWRQ